MSERCTYCLYLSTQASEDPAFSFHDPTKVKNPQLIGGGMTGPTDPDPRTEAYVASTATYLFHLLQMLEMLTMLCGLSGPPVIGMAWLEPAGLDSKTFASFRLQRLWAGVDVRLEPHAYRELHWYIQGDWTLMLNGSVRIQDNTFLVSELLECNPELAVAKNFCPSTENFKNLPDSQLKIFPGTPTPADIEQQNVTGPTSVIRKEFTYIYHFSKQEPYRVPGGAIKVIDLQTFPIVNTFSAALTIAYPGATREMHWHTTSDEWILFKAALVLLSTKRRRLAAFDFTASDVGFAPHYSDIGVNQWLGLVPIQIVKDHLNVGDQFLATLPKVEPFILPRNPNLETPNFTRNSS
ncbi:RmlC-like cupin [Lojkania enalia]|uniref:RmlC-like cupin n=1 Tax=Lojkania enalia TaxID=147567 RepID=A0A9P4JW42_9PLEO|nr:RmlC-like cupin [Didymosphaeria enalia]